jgi:hypothetical protein
MARTCDCDPQQNLPLNGSSCLSMHTFPSIIGGQVKKVTNYMIIHLSLSCAADGDFMEVVSLWELLFIVH